MNSMSVHPQPQEQRLERQTTEENEMKVAEPSHKGLEKAFYNVDCMKELEAICSRSVTEK